MKMNMIKTHVVWGVALVSLTALIAGCEHSPSSGSQSANYAPACSSNPYLMKYNCSINKIQSAAENGSADAQYALGYMYYYGIGTVKDKQTADLWIQRSAAQGQPLAKKAWTLINTGATFTDLHHAAYSPTILRSELSNVNSTAALPTGFRPVVPLKITSDMDCPRNCFADVSPVTQRIASTILDLPQPLGPTTAFM